MTQPNIKGRANSGAKVDRSRPVCGSMAVALPLFVAVVGFAAIHSSPEGDSGSLGIYILAAYSLVGAMIAGLILAGIALLRREKWSALPWMAIFLNSMGLLLLIRLLI